MKKMVDVNHTCCHEELIQEHSLLIAKLDEKSKYKEQSIMEIKDELKTMNAKIDAINSNVNKLILNSETQDTEIENRIKNLETKIEVYEKFFQTLKDDQEKRSTRLIAILAVMVTIIGIIVGAVVKFI